MWTTIAHFFKKLEKQDHDPPNFESNYYSGRSYNIIRYGIYRDLFSINDIYLTDLNNPLYCAEIIPTLDYKSSQNNFSNRYLLLSRSELFKKYGPFDLIKFYPICATIFFKREKLHLIEAGILYGDEVFMFKNKDNKLRTTLDKTDYFEKNTNLVFIPAFINYNFLLTAFTVDISEIDFLLAATGFIRLKIINVKKVDPNSLTFQWIDTLDKAHMLLTNSKKHLLGLTPIIYS